MPDLVPTRRFAAARQQILISPLYGGLYSKYTRALTFQKNGLGLLGTLLLDVAAKARHVSALKKSFSGTANPVANLSSCGRWVLGEGELQSEVVKIEGLLSAHATELAHLHAFYAVSTLSGERQLLRKRVAQEQREGRDSSVGKLDTGGTGHDDRELRLTMLQFSRLVCDCAFVGEGDNLSAVDALYLAALRTDRRLSRAKSEAHASAATAQRPSTAGNSRRPATGASRRKQCGGGGGGGSGGGVDGGGLSGHGGIDRRHSQKFLYSVFIQ